MCFTHAVQPGLFLYRPDSDASSDEEEDEPEEPPAAAPEKPKRPADEPALVQCIEQLCAGMGFPEDQVRAQFIKQNGNQEKILNALLG